MLIEFVESHKPVNYFNNKHVNSSQLVVSDTTNQFLMQMLIWIVGKTPIDRMKAHIIVYVHSSSRNEDKFRCQFDTWIFLTHSDNCNELYLIIAHRQNDTVDQSSSTNIADELNIISELPDNRLLKLCSESLTTRQVRAVLMIMAQLNHLDQTFRPYGQHATGLSQCF